VTFAPDENLVGAEHALGVQFAARHHPGSRRIALAPAAGRHGCPSTAARSDCPAPAGAPRWSMASGLASVEEAAALDRRQLRGGRRARAAARRTTAGRARGSPSDHRAFVDDDELGLGRPARRPRARSSASPRRSLARPCRSGCGWSRARVAALAAHHAGGPCR